MSKFSKLNELAKVADENSLELTDMAFDAKSMPPDQFAQKYDGTVSWQNVLDWGIAACEIALKFLKWNKTIRMILITLIVILQGLKAKNSLY